MSFDSCCSQCNIKMSFCSDCLCSPNPPCLTTDLCVLCSPEHIYNTCAANCNKVVEACALCTNDHEESLVGIPLGKEKSIHLCRDACLVEYTPDYLNRLNGLFTHFNSLEPALNGEHPDYVAASIHQAILTHLKKMIAVATLSDEVPKCAICEMAHTTDHKLKYWSNYPKCVVYYEAPCDDDYRCELPRPFDECLSMLFETVPLCPYMCGDPTDQKQLQTLAGLERKAYDRSPYCAMDESLCEAIKERVAVVFDAS
eukprot:m.21225 g.21225  ORF g.21225 m.21225 type:complete len:256 (+) comp11115_c0_seq4:270-1037(+)